MCRTAVLHVDALCVPTDMPSEIVSTGHYSAGKCAASRCVLNMCCCVQRYIEVCKTNEAGLISCPETQAQGAAIIVAAAAWPEVLLINCSLTASATQLYANCCQR